MAILIHEETKDRRNRSRKKPIGLSLATSVTSLGPNLTSHIESLESTKVNSWIGGDGKPYSSQTNRNDRVEIPYLSAPGIMLTYAISANESAAINKALEKLKDTRINLAVSIAEMPETLKMFLNGGKVIIKAYKATVRKEQKLRRLFDRLRQSAVGGGKSSRTRRRKQAKFKSRDLEKEVASLWLAWRYGIMPLVYDAQGLLEELNRPKEVKGQVIRVKTSSKLSHQQDLPGYMLITAVPASKRREILDVEIRHSVCLNCVVEKPRSLTQLGFTNGLAVIWEVTPLSFVLDWWLNIGETLSVIDAGTGTSFVSGTISEKRQVSRKIDGGQYSTVLGTSSTVETWLPAHSFEKSYKRAVLDSLPSPQFYVSNNMNKKRVVDAFALLKTILFSKK